MSYKTSFYSYKTKSKKFVYYYYSALKKVFIHSFSSSSCQGSPLFLQSSKNVSVNILNEKKQLVSQLIAGKYTNTNTLRVRII